MFKNVPSAKKTDAIANKIISYSYELKGIITSNFKEYDYDIDLESIEYSTFMYDLFFYSQVMQVKYSSFFINATIKSILINLENNLRKGGNNIQKDYLSNIFVKLSKSLNDVSKMSQQQGVNPIFGAAFYYCTDELRLTEEQIEMDENLVDLIAKHFQKIINIPEKDI